MDGKQISQVEKFMFLGLTINETLTWKDHMENIANRISKTLGILSRLKHSLPHNILKMIYTSLILPRLHCCNLAWGFRPGRIELLQKKLQYYPCRQPPRMGNHPSFVASLAWHRALFLYKAPHLGNHPSFPFYNHHFAWFRWIYPSKTTSLSKKSCQNLGRFGTENVWGSFWWFFGYSSFSDIFDEYFSL